MVLCGRVSGSLALCPGLQGWSGEIEHTEASRAVGHACGSVPLCQQTWGRMGGAWGRHRPCFQQGKQWQEVCEPIVGHGDKNLPVCYWQRRQECGKTDAASKSSTFHIGLSCRAQIIGAVWIAKPLLLQAQYSPTVLSGLCGQIMPTQVAGFSSRASRVDCDLLAMNAA